ncbi:MAG: hypothetical protein JST82_00670 [Bacteroidetes bacterium]|nr:hypothetical protein [Bacteroidota bacterium]
MDKNLMVYPISSGNELDIFSTEAICSYKIMDMNGTMLIGDNSIDGKHNIVNIAILPSATYILEATFVNKRTGRSVFVKL